jgi:hypothetical protein
MIVNRRAQLKASLTAIFGQRCVSALRSIYWRAMSAFPLASTRKVDVPHTFCEFGFHMMEFNCSRLVRRGWEGLLIDGDKANVALAAKMLARMGASTRAVHSFLTMANVRAVVEGSRDVRPLGILSVDVDGNDYWLLRELLPLGPCLIVAEYNASLGTRALATPYDPVFMRHEKHDTGWYHGASIVAISRLCGEAGYSLVGVSSGGQNLFLLKNTLLNASTPKLDPREAYKENSLRNQWSSTTAAQQWAAIRHLPFVEV